MDGASDVTPNRRGSVFAKEMNARYHIEVSDLRGAVHRHRYARRILECEARGFSRFAVGGGFYYGAPIARYGPHVGGAPIVAPLGIRGWIEY